MAANELTPQERRIIEEKGTERPFTGEYHDHFADGVYLCRRCNSPLYDSQGKFAAHCGWPSFDAEIPGAVTRKSDPDGIRTEILCTTCAAHLGHIFCGENLTEKNIRHCVNSLSLRFIPRKLQAGQKGLAVLGGGCFWCLEAAYLELKGIAEVVSGYCGGSKANPTYEEVCTGTTGHAEVVKLVYEPKIITYRQILSVFFSVHDPTTPNRQGSDLGEQYRSIIFYTTWEQKEESELVISELTKEKVFARPIITEVLPLIKFYPAEEYHQAYFQKHPEQAYCQWTIAPKLKKIKEKYQRLLR